MTYIELVRNGYKRTGNWFVKESISINLFSKTLRETKHKFDIDFKSLDNLTIDKINNLIEALEEINNDSMGLHKE